MDKIGYIDSINNAAINIDAGRRGFATRGKEQEGRLSYEDGIAKALAVFQEAQSSADPLTLILAEYAFLSQELYLCSETDKEARDSLTKAKESFDDAFLALQAVEEPGYIIGDKLFPHKKEYRIKEFPKDAFHIACIAHKVRLNNILRFSGIDPIEKALLYQRRANLTTAQNGYVNKQKKAMAVYKVNH